MEIWIPITIIAAFLQNARSALQKILKDNLSTWGVTSARFVFAAPLAVTFFSLFLLASDQSLPNIGVSFLGYAMLGGIAQIIATGLLIHLFSFQNFTVATAFTKTEPVQVAIFGIVLLGDRITFEVAVAILISLLGVVLISIPRDRLVDQRLFDKKALIGIASGALFGLSAISYRGASLSLLEGDVLLRASITLAVVTSFQAFVLLTWLKFREPGQIKRLVTHWKIAGAVGVVGMLGSLAWFTAFTLENAAHVRVVGQIEIIFMIAASTLVFKESISLREIVGLVLVSIGIIGLVTLG